MDVHDHRNLGAKLDLFHQQEDAPGTAFWHSRGTTICLLLESYIRCEMQRAGFLEVRTPQLMSRSLWERSGHWSRFGDNMFAFEDGNREYALKPMNCPEHVQLFRSRTAPATRRAGPGTDEAWRRARIARNGESAAPSSAARSETLITPILIVLIVHQPQDPVVRYRASFTSCVLHPYKTVGLGHGRFQQSLLRSVHRRA